MTQLQRQHYEIYDAVTARRGREAAELLRGHIEWFHARIPDDGGNY
ncbi:hypothetical protein MUG94_03730 [Arthrobacter gengyunqii]|uniref:FCD domain-containing protein n=1 Tax=Arthrobacter gengyunqii TaxID=2886940 RepID=A0A9X1S6U2_9MICC|nr:hypothetical protein [Arthrobacter gengyunqii]MCC3270193.1 hypothetical protein [Arthrobacter gengyunqii]UOY96898.1 hypothetical protein MUG94_03730 [Arthrobacter gengyunqii]